MTRGTGKRVSDTGSALHRKLLSLPPGIGTTWSLNERPVVQVRVIALAGPDLSKRVVWESEFGRGETELRAFKRKFQQI